MMNKMPIGIRCGHKWYYDGHNKFAYCYHYNKEGGKQEQQKIKNIY